MVDRMVALGFYPKLDGSKDQVLALGYGNHSDDIFSVKKNFLNGIAFSDDIYGTKDFMIPNSGYIQLDTFNGSIESLPVSDCDEIDEAGRMKVDTANELLYTCMLGGWNSI